MTTSSGDIINDGTDGRGEDSAGSGTSFGRAKPDPAEAETVSGSNSESPPAPLGVGGITSEGVGSSGSLPGTPSGEDQTPAGAGAPSSPDAGAELGGSGGAEGASGAGAGGESQQPSAEREDSGQPSSELEDELARVNAQRDEYLDLAQRTQADFENYRKRVAKDLIDARSKAVAGTVRELLPAVDNIERALRAAEAEGAAEGALIQGVRMVHEELHGFLERLGLKVIDADGASFDPAVHEAIASVPVEGVEAGTITEVHQHGYRLGELVVRPARVVVSA